MKRDSYSDQKSHASFQPRSLQSASEPTQLNQPNHHSSAPASKVSAPNWLSKASSWVSDKVQTAQNLLNDSGDAIASDQILPGLKGTANQPLVGVIDTGYGRDEHGSKMVEAIQKKNPQAAIWKGGGVGTGGGLESLAEFVDVAKATGHSHAVANLSFDLTEVHPDGSTSTRTQLTAKEQSALAYARDNGVLVVASSGNQGGVMSALGQASQPSDNLIVVGAANEGDRAPYSSYGKGLDLVAEVGTAGTSSAAANVTGTIAKLWSTNPELSNQQINQILTTTATDLKTPGWDAETGAGLLNSTGAIDLASQTIPQTAPKSVAQTVVFSGAKLTQKGSAFGTTPSIKSRSWTSLDGAIASDRPNWDWGDIGHGVLDVAGFIPVVGAVADVANSGWYAAEGDYANAAISLASAVPGVGDAFAAGAKAVKATKAITEGVQVAKAIPSVAKVTDTASHIAVKAPPIDIPKVVPVKSSPISVAKTPTKEVPTTSSSKIAPPTQAPPVQSVSTTPKVAPVKSNSINVTGTPTKEVPTTSSSKIAPSSTGKSEATPSVGTPKTTTGSSGGNLQKAVAATTVAATVAATVAPIVSKGDSKPNPSGSNPAPTAPPDPKLTPPPNTLNNGPGSTPPTKSKQPDAQKHTIQPGDTLWKIAQDQLGNGDRWHELRKLDGSSFTEQEASRLKPGDAIVVPGAQSNVAQSPTKSPWSPPPMEQPDPTPYIHDTRDLKYAQDTGILSRLHEIRQGESLSQFADRIKTRIYDKNGVEITNSNQAPMPEKTNGTPSPELNNPNGGRPAAELLPGNATPQQIATLQAILDQHPDSDIQSRATTPAGRKEILDRIREVMDNPEQSYNPYSTQPDLSDPSMNIRIPSGSTEEDRRQLGVAQGGENLPDSDRLLPLSDNSTGEIPGQLSGRIGMIPGQIADRMRGMHFDNFRQFRETLWKFVEQDPSLREGWSTNNLDRMRQGKSPFTPETEHVGGERVYQLDHSHDLQHGGGVYDLDSIRIVTPRSHDEYGN